MHTSFSVPEIATFRAAAFTVVTAGAVGGLYYGQIVLIPVALSILLTFLFTPVVRLFERLRVGRIVSVLAVGVLLYSALAVVLWITTVQGAALVAALPGYRANIAKKVEDVRGLSRGGAIERLQETWEDATAEPEGTERKPSGEPPPVVVARDESWTVWSVPGLLGPWVSPLGTLALVAVLVPFMLLERGSLTDRVIRLMGRRRLATTTRALDEAAERVSRYLMMQAIVNGTYGVLVGAGLWLIGVPYAALFGFLSAVLRFIPYVGPWIAALLPFGLSLIVFDGWTRPALVAVLFLALELFSNLVLETVLYAGSAGVSQVALLVAIAVWTTLWGPIGLVLATPLTVCLVVFAKHIPELRFLVVLMTDERVVAPDVGYYQRLLSDDPDGATTYLDEYARSTTAGHVHDTVLLSALQQVRRDRAAGTIAEAEEARVVETIVRALDQLEDDDEPEAAPADFPATVLGCPALDRADEVSLELLARLVRSDGIGMRVLPATLLTAEVVAEIAAQRPNAVVIASLPPGGLAEARHLVKRLERLTPRPWIVVARWGVNDNAAAPPEALPGTVTTVVRSLADARAQLQALGRTVRVSAA